MLRRLRVYVQSLRRFRVWHRYLGLGLALFLLVSAVTGLLLGWKKDADWIQPPTQRGEAKSLSAWLPLDRLADTATAGLYAARPDQRGNPVDRLDVRPGKGIVKVLFEQDNWEVQVDGGTGAVLSVAKRHSDWIESLHDGSIISDGFKLVSMNALGAGLVLMTATGVWLWYGPRVVRRIKGRQR